jgi:hypothetical protein
LKLLYQNNVTRPGAARQRYCSPSRDKSKLKISSDAKLVNCFGGEPSIEFWAGRERHYVDIV